MPTLGIYVQIPFCASKCSFCNFSSSVERREAIDITLSALVEEIHRLPTWYAAEGISPHLFALPANSIYFGGGTPPLAGPTRLTSVLDALAAGPVVAPVVFFGVDRDREVHERRGPSRPGNRQA